MTEIAQVAPSRQIFISYSRKNRDFAIDLYNRLKALDFDLWRDVHDIKADASDWWQEIKEAVNECDTLILCMSLSALKSQIVSDEWMLARTIGKRIIPVVAEDIWDHPEVQSETFTIPNWMQRRNWIDYRDHMPESSAAWQNLIDTLNSDYEPKPFITMVPELPPRFVSRPELTDRIIGKLVDDKRDAIAMTTALRGAGGYGKTTLAKAVARDVRLQGAFDDGILWLTMGEELVSLSGDKLKNALIQRAEELIAALTTERPVLNTLEMCHIRLNEAIGKRYILLVIDDVWDKSHLEPFLLNGEHSSCLITTRNADTVNQDDIEQEAVYKMEPIEAVKLLSAGIYNEEAVESNLGTLEALARDLREYPLLLALANTQITNWMVDMNLTLAQALDYAREVLEEQGVLGFGDDDAFARDRAVANTLEVSLRQLETIERQRYLELAIFPEDALIPLTTLSKYWGISRVQTMQYCEKLYRKTALLHSFEGEKIRIHDVFRDYLIRQHNDEELIALHRRLVANYEDLSNLKDDYAWRNMAYHLREAGDLEILRDLLLNFNYLQNKLISTDANALLADYDYLFDDYALQLVKSALSISAHVIGRDPQQLDTQLYGRLLSHRQSQAPIDALLNIIENNQTKLFCLPHDQTMQAAGGALLRTLEGHSSAVNSVTMQGEIAISASSDRTLRVWNWRTGEVKPRPIKHPAYLNSVAMQDEIAISACFDRSLKIWNWQTGQLLRTLEGHTADVKSVVMQGDIAISASSDRTLKIWNWQTGQLLQTLEGHSATVTQVTMQGDFVISASRDCAIIVWNWQTGEALLSLEGHTADVNSIVMQDDIAISASSDRTLKIWNWQSGELLMSLEGHSAPVTSVTMQRDIAISASADRTLKVWNWRTGKLLQTLEGHSGVVMSVTMQGDVAISTSADDTVKVWNWQSGIGKSAEISDPSLYHALAGHTKSVTSLAVQGNILISASTDNTLKVWDQESATVISTLTGHSGDITDIAIQDEIVISASDDRTLRVWNWQEGRHMYTLAGHMRPVNSIVVQGDIAISTSADQTIKIWNWRLAQILRTVSGHASWVNNIVMQGKIAISSSSDRTVMVWDWQEGELLHTLEGHTDTVNRVAIQDEFAISASDDHSLRLWNWQSGQFLESLLGHLDKVNCVVMHGNYAISASDDHSLKLWNWQSCECLLTVSLDAPILTCALATDGKTIIAGDAAGTLHFLHTSAALAELLRG